MTFETILHKGKKNMPLAIFIHGMGMNEKVWSNPYSSEGLKELLPDHANHAEVLFDKEVRDGIVNAVENI